MKRIFISLLCTSVLVTAACVRTSAIRLAGAETLAQTRPEDVEVYLSARDVPGSYTRLALIFAEEWSGVPTYGEMVAQMRVKAARIGANGLILEEMAKRVDIGGGDEEPIRLDNEKTVKGVAIYVKK